MALLTLRATDGADSFAFAAGDGAARILNFEVGVDSLSTSPYEAVVREVVRADGVPVTIYRYGWGNDVIRLPGVTGVTREQLEQPGAAAPAPAAGNGVADAYHFSAWQGAATIEGFEVGLDSLSATTAYGYEPWVLETTRDGVAGTEYRYGWADDVVWLPGVTGVTVEQLEQPAAAVPAPAAGNGVADAYHFSAWQGAATIEGFEVGLDSLSATTAYGYEPWVLETTRDGVAGTEYRYGWADDVVWLPGVTGVTVEQLEQRSGGGAAPAPAEPPPAADPGTGGGLPPSTGGAFRTVFYDGFDVDGDLSQWKAIMQGPHHTGMWWNPDGVRVHNGELEVSADKQANGYYTGAGLAIEYGPDAFGVDYGRIEVRAKWDGGQGIAPAIMGWPSAADAWPPEFDLMEVIDADGQWVATTNHWQGPGGSGDDTYRTEWTQIDSTQWHTYAVEWTPDGITYTIDGRVVYTGGPEELPGQKMTASIGVFVGTWGTQGWIPLPDETTPDHVGLHVDYVKVEEWIGG